MTAFEAKVIARNGQFSFDILDTSDTMEVGDEVLSESLYTSGDYAQESTADRNAAKMLKQFRAAGRSELHRLCGYTA